MTFYEKVTRKRVPHFKVRLTSKETRLPTCKLGKSTVQRKPSGCTTTRFVSM
jgi:hypothetical protein